MSRVKDGPTIHVRPETRKELGRVKNDLELKSLDEAIKSLLARPDFTRDELSDIRYYLVTFMQTFKSVDTSDVKKLVRKIEGYTQVTVEEQRRAGEELRKKLIEDTGLPEAPSVNSRCLTGEEEKKVDEMLKEYFRRQEEAEKECRDETNKRVVKALVDGAEGKMNDKQV